jgi:hypothetical protein
MLALCRGSILLCLVFIYSGQGLGAELNTPLKMRQQPLPTLESMILGFSGLVALVPRIVRLLKFHLGCQSCLSPLSVLMSKHFWQDSARSTGLDDL